MTSNAILCRNDSSRRHPKFHGGGTRGFEELIWETELPIFYLTNPIQLCSTRQPAVLFSSGIREQTIGKSHPLLRLMQQFDIIPVRLRKYLVASNEKLKSFLYLMIASTMFLRKVSKSYCFFTFDTFLSSIRTEFYCMWRKDCPNSTQLWGSMIRNVKFKILTMT